MQIYTFESISTQKVYSKRKAISKFQHKEDILRLAKILLKHPCICNMSQLFDQIYEPVEGMKSTRPPPFPEIDTN